MVQWWMNAGITHADVAVRQTDGTMCWNRGVALLDLPLPWARAKNAKGGEVFARPARDLAWPLVFLDDVSEDLARRTARKYDALVVKTSSEGGCHVWLSCTRSLTEAERHLAQAWLAPRAGADVAATSGEHLGRLAGFKNWKRNGTWVNVVSASSGHVPWQPPADLSRSGHLAETRSCSDSSPSGEEWGWVCGMLEAGMPPRLTYYRLVERARRRRGRDAERYARHTVTKAIARTRQSRLRR